MLFCELELGIDYHFSCCKLVIMRCSCCLVDEGSNLFERSVYRSHRR